MEDKDIETFIQEYTVYKRWEGFTNVAKKYWGYRAEKIELETSLESDDEGGYDIYINTVTVHDRYDIKLDFAVDEFKLTIDEAVERKRNKEFNEKYGENNTYDHHVLSLLEERMREDLYNVNIDREMPDIYYISQPPERTFENIYSNRYTTVDIKKLDNSDHSFLLEHITKYGNMVGALELEYDDYILVSMPSREWFSVNVEALV